METEWGEVEAWEVPCLSSFSGEGCSSEVLASSLPLGTRHAHAEGGLLWCDQREAERSRVRQRDGKNLSKEKRKKRKKKDKDREKKGLKIESESDRKKKGGARRAQQPMVCLRAAGASRAGVQQTEEKHVCPRGRDWKTGSKSRQGNLHDTHCIKATRLIWKRGKKGKRRRKGEAEVAQSRVYLSGTPVSLC